MSFEGDPCLQNEFGTLQGCFVEGSAEERARERRMRRRSLIISISVQTALLTVVLLLPLFAKPERLTYTVVAPPPPYARARTPERANTPNRPANPRTHIDNNPYAAPPRIPSRLDPNPPTPPAEPPGTPGFSQTPPCVGCIPINDGRLQPAPPTPQTPEPPRRIVMTHLEPAMLIYRVEPKYPPLAIQIHRGGRVELRAIIATDGTIQSLQVVSGDPIFLQSAEAAVRQWRYRPTVLNGRPVEIDTFITVTYNLAQ